MNDFITNSLIVLGFGLIVFGVYQFSLAWAFITLGVGVVIYGLVMAVVAATNHNKKEKK